MSCGYETSQWYMEQERNEFLEGLKQVQSNQNTETDENSIGL